MIYPSDFDPGANRVKIKHELVGPQTYNGHIPSRALLKSTQLRRMRTCLILEMPFPA